MKYQVSHPYGETDTFRSLGSQTGHGKTEPSRMNTSKHFPSLSCS